ncbi:MAG: hypothetical protein LKE79_05080 [Lachnospiraceae bacterium]|jgi:hypothetical protein|nr:hypothetical protein [Lachnospiraceae bacterium]MCH4063976.1 hypothetical protein [Lachnospiraceae bacterium]MCH4103301.1 hypothetical protein [Lachnospiraceae bacterium]
MARHVIDKISDNERQIFEIIILILLAGIPFLVNLKSIFNDYLLEQPLSPDNIVWQLAIRGRKDCVKYFV